MIKVDRKQTNEIFPRTPQPIVYLVGASKPGACRNLIVIQGIERFEWIIHLLKLSRTQSTRKLAFGLVKFQ